MAMNDRRFTGLCMSGTAEEVKAALNDGANPNAKDDECITALMKAADFNEDTRVIAVLLEAGADIRARSTYYMTALDWAEGRTPDKRREKLAVLKSAVLSLDVIDDDIFATFCGYANPCEIHGALKKGANPNAANTPHGTTTLMSAVRKNNGAIDTLLEAGADIHARDKEGQTALMYAETPGVIRRLLDAGSEVDARTNDGATFLMLEAQFGELEIVDYLLEAGAYVNARDNMRRTPLFYAAWNKDTRVITRIITELQSAGKNINTIRAVNGETALMHSARYCRNAEVIRILLGAGADLHARDKEGRNALDYAEAGRTPPEVRHEVRQYLADAGEGR
ncbi:MAG: ankyrin repeat domain-containing protein [Synergistaceae bacterium]|nr:ankyrin repeat domain-containing protein [Synergistaceae bacterium]